MFLLNVLESNDKEAYYNFWSMCGKIRKPNRSSANEGGTSSNHFVKYDLITGQYKPKEGEGNTAVLGNTVIFQDR